MIELHPYQHESVMWLASRKQAMIAHEMGLGKSAIAIRAADRVGAKNILVVCPATARENWADEFKKFATVARPVNVIVNGKQTYKPGVNIISPNLMVTLKTSKKKWCVLVPDEAHGYKSIHTQRSKALLGKGGYVHRAKRTWLLTGTPAPNHVGELWPFLRVFGATQLPYWKFVYTYCRVREGGFGERQIVGSKVEKANEIKALLAPVMLRFLKRDVLKDMPALTLTNHYVEADPKAFIPSPAQKAELKKEMAFLTEVIESDTFAHDPAAFASSISALRRIIGLQKVKAVGNQIADELSLGAYRKIVIFGVHKDVIAALADRLREFGVVVITGATPTTKRHGLVEKFQEDPNIGVFLGNIQAAGTAINLTAASQVAFIEYSFVPGDNAQALMRCHRIGQGEPVYARFFGIQGSIDAQISAILKTKTNELLSVFN